MTLRVTKFNVGDEELIVISRPVPVSAKRLTPAEIEVAKLVEAGLSNVAIATLRKRSERTIANQIANILQKLGVASRHQIVCGQKPPSPSD